MPKSEHYTPAQIKKFQQLLLGARKARSMTQSQAAEAIGVSQALISSLERGPSSGTRVAELFRVLGYYGISADEVSSVLGYLKLEGEHRAQDPRVRKLLLAVDAIPTKDFDTILDALDFMLRGALVAS